MTTCLEIQRTSVIDDGERPSVPGAPSNIAGYSLVERIGTGGYGEVWRAIGPGGLPKAVKILFGQRDGQQAEVELKSLERVRELRHPFLLSIERIEVFDGRLIVVSELADRCMEDRFEQATQDGLVGIPRDELLRYLRDAADALDFMSEQHGLQHLDIKPANLLLQGEHVMVGDFGLTKDITATAVSMMGGFTPLYSSPEIFEGRPSSNSDQYSLAIVYQMMLTGVPPYAGRTAAQLTAQHLRSTPDLSSLQPVDRPVVARALSKSPHSRFQSCRQFVDELGKRRNSVVRSQKRSGLASTHDLPDLVHKTKVVDAGTMGASGEIPVLETEPLAPSPRNSAEVTYRPTIFIGIGGLAGRVLSQLRARFDQQWGVSDVPAFPMLYIDTDARSLSGARSRHEQAGLQEHELLHIPLRSSKEFRSGDHRPLDWLSRRWLYNIPRSGQVEGMRPLGRLALVDHEQEVRDRLKEVISAAITNESAEATTASTQLPIVAGPPDIYVIASTTGGTGSGTVLDVSYLARELCARLKVEPGLVAGVLLHSTGAMRQASDVQEASTISFLRELEHFSTPGLGGPRGLADHPATSESKPFDDTYLVHLGDGLSESDLSEQAQNVADYLHANAATSGRANFQAWRSAEQNEWDLAHTTIRTFGAAAIDESAFRAIQDEAQKLCHALTGKWAGKAELRSDDTLDQAPLAETRELLTELGLTGNQIQGKVIQAVGGSAGKAFTARAQQLCDGMLAEAGDQGPEPRTLFERIVSELSATADDGLAANGSPAAVTRAILNQSMSATDHILTVTGDNLYSFLDRPQRLRGAEAALGELLRVLEAAAQSCSRSLADIERLTSQVSQVASPGDDETLASPVRHDAESLREQCHQIALLCCSQAICQGFKDQVVQVYEELKTVSVQFLALRTRLDRLSGQFSTQASAENSLSESVVQAFDDYLLSQDEFHLAGLIGEIEDSAAGSTLQDEAMAFLLAQSADAGQSPSCRHVHFPKPAHPVLANIGGGRRVLAMLPESASAEHWQQKLVDEFGNCVSLRTTDQGRLHVFCEVEGIDIDSVLAQLTRHNPHLSEVAARIHTRNDIEW